MLDEAEVLDLGVAPSARRLGVATRLLARKMFLEVACDNHAARVLYDRAGYAWVDWRTGYFRRASDGSDGGAGGGRVDVLVLRKDLAPERNPFPDLLLDQS